MILRPVLHQDKGNILKWRNAQPELGNGELVSKKEHDAWFNWAMVSDNHLMFVVRPEVGYIRFKRAGMKVYVSVYIDPLYRGQGIGVRAIKEGTATCLSTWSDGHVLAEIHSDNKQSCSAFEKAGYEVHAKEEGCVTYGYTG